jgi:hypothetical protein
MKVKINKGDMMKPYTLDFVKAAINDTEVKAEFLVDYVLPIIEDEIGNVPEHRMDFIKKYYTQKDLVHAEKLVVNIVEGEVEHFAEMAEIDISNFDDIDGSRIKWERTEFAPDFEMIMEELNMAQDIEIDAHIDLAPEPNEYKF